LLAPPTPPQHRISYPRFLAALSRSATTGNLYWYAWMTVLTALVLVAAR